MIYRYKCTNTKCKNLNKEVSISLPMSEYKNPQQCNECNKDMIKVFSSFGLKTSGDGYKV